MRLEEDNSLRPEDEFESIYSRTSGVKTKTVVIFLPSMRRLARRSVAQSKCSMSDRNKKAM